MAGRMAVGRCFGSPNNWFGFIRNLHYGRSKRPLRIYSFDPTEPAELGEMAKAESSEYWESFMSWRSIRHKHYVGEKEILYRFEIFCETMKSIEYWNSKAGPGPNAARFGLNEFSDLTWEESPFGCPLKNYSEDDEGNLSDFEIIDSEDFSTEVESDPDDYTTVCEFTDSDLEEKSDTPDELQPPKENF